MARRRLGSIRRFASAALGLLSITAAAAFISFSDSSATADTKVQASSQAGYYELLDSIRGIPTLSLSGIALSMKAGAAEADLKNSGWFNLAQHELAAREYFFSKENNGHYQAPNRAQNLRVRLTSEGVTLTKREPFDGANAAQAYRLLDRNAPGGDDFSISLRLTGLAKETKSGATVTSISGGAKTGPKVTSGRAELGHGTVTEWYKNTEEGIEQGFTIHDRPTGSGSVVLTQKLNGAALHLDSPTAATFRDAKSGKVVASYNKLLVSDAMGKELPAHLEAKGNRLRIVYSDRGATYPVVVDPLITTPASTFEINQADAYLGYSVASAGDVNGDGYSDVIVGSYYYDNGQTDEGAAFVYLGSASGLSATPARTFEGNQADAFMGYFAASAGDVNGDGYSDVIVGAYGYDNGVTDEGAAFVYHGSASGLSASPARTFEGNQAGAYMGRSVASAGDVNGDGYSDVVVGAYGYDNGQTDEGAAFVYHGSASGLSASPASTFEGNQADAWMGFTGTTAGDVNGDGYSDVVVGARDYDNGQTDEGATFVYHGSASGLSATPASTYESNQASAHMGSSVASAGDVNGDGYSDVVVGARDYDNGQADEGAAFVYHGSASGLSATPSLTLDSNQANAYMGISVASAGDVNGDGYSDVIVGAHYYDNGESNEGAAFVYQGSASGLSATADSTFEGNQAGAWMGRFVASAGDVDGDGYSDVIIGAPSYDNGQIDEGAAFVYQGSASGLSTTANSTLDNNQGYSFLGASVAGAGDVNGDGYSDVIVGSYFYDNGELNEGGAFVYQGSASGLSTTPASTVQSNQANAQMGYSVASAGDVNADGYSDVIVGAAGYDNGQAEEGAAFVYHGSASGLSATPGSTLDSNQAGAESGRSVSGAGDVNGDGYSDVIVGARLYDNGQAEEGAAFVYHGSASGLSATPASTLEGNQANAFMGISVAGAGDVNRDGHSDVIVGAYYYDNGQADEGAAFVYHGSASGLSATPASTFEGDQASAWMGISVASAGDVNGDGYSDVIVGATGYDNIEFNEGAAFVYHGSSSGLSATAASTLESNQDYAYMGLSAANAGDVNGDGYSDVIVGAHYYDNGQSNEGAAFVYHGSASGLSATPASTFECNQADALMGYSAASAGDVNGDGYSDVIVGAHSYDNGQTDEGGAFVYHGNGGGGMSVLPRQRRGNDSAPIEAGLTTDSSGNPRIKVIARSPFGRAKVKLEWELKSADTAFNGSGTQRSSSWTSTGTSGVTMDETLTGLSAGYGYHWRARVLYHPSSGTGHVAGRWVWIPGNSLTEMDFHVGLFDSTSPITTLSTSPISPNGTNSWFTSSPTITLSRNESGATGYRWDGAASNTVYSSAFAYNGGEGTHTLYYQSTDDAGNTEDAQSQLFKVDTVNPSAPTLSGDLNGTTAADLSWTTASDATSGVVGYKLYNADTNALLDTTASTSASRTGLSASTTYRYYVRSYDAAGNTSAASNTVSVTTPPPATTTTTVPPTTTTTIPPTTTTTVPGPDVTPPTTPATLSGRQTGTGEITLNWTPASDAGGLSGYKVYNATGDAVLATLNSSTRTKVFTGVPAGSNRRYYVKAYDTSSNYSAASNMVSITVSSTVIGDGTTSPSAPGDPVTVSPIPEISLNFTTINSGGTTTVTTSSSPPQGELAGFSVLGNYFQIETNATFTGPITVCINYPEPTGGGQENNLRLMHYPDSGSPENITTSVDTENNIICGVTTGFSHFGVGFPHLANTGGSNLGILAAIGLILLGGSMLGYRMRRLSSAA